MSDTGMSPEAEDWVLHVYAPAVRSIAATLREAGAADPDHLAGAILARLVALDPPLVVERLDRTAEHIDQDATS